MIFRILWTEYDGSWEWIFSHDNKSEEEFILDCQMAIREVGADYIDSDDDYWRGYHDWIDLAAKVLLEKGYKKDTIAIYHTQMRRLYVSMTEMRKQSGIKP